MSFLLTKLLPQLLYPLGLCCVLLVIALVCRRRRWLQYAAVAMATIVIMASGNSWLALRFVRSLEWRYPPTTEVPSGEVIVVLGGATRVTSLPLLEGAAADRITHAAELYEQGKAPRLLLTGGGVPWRDPGSSEATRMAAVLRHMDVPPEVMWLETESRNTRENALFSRRILADKGIHRIILVTSALHMPRAKATFERVGLEVDPAPTDFFVTPLKWELSRDATWSQRVLEVLPSPGDMALTTAALKEYLGIEVYRLRGWL